MSRRRRERALALRPPDPLDRTRALARFGRLVGRAVTFGFVPCGPVVEADTPAELGAAVERAILAEVGKRPRV